MDLTLDVSPNESTKEGFAVSKILEANGGHVCHLDIQFSKFSALPRFEPRAVDFLLAASAVYAIDKMVHRDSALDGWTRELKLDIPVSDTRSWTAAKVEFEKGISFLTGDLWSFEFAQQRANPIRPRRRRRVRRRRIVRPIHANCVSLFSGGLDSLIGVIDWLESHPDQQILLVGHHDGDMSGPHSDQKSLLQGLEHFYPGRVRAILARIGHSNEDDRKTEITLRGRSLTFIALGMLAASSLGPGVPLLIPENGTIALNVPLTPSRRGSCSTRTAHPHYLESLSRALTSLGLVNPMSNPLESKTKGEAVSGCLNQQVLGALARQSVSCAKRGHKVHWTRRTASSCGRCMPCIYRRAAMHAAGWDDEVYGDDICDGEVDIQAEGEKPNDLRACFSFLSRNHTREAVGAMLMANGPLDSRSILEKADVVQRAMNEIRQLLRDKGNREIKRQAGIR